MKYYRIMDGDKYKKPLFGRLPLIYNDLGRGNYALRDCKIVEDWDDRNTLFFDDYEIAENYPPTTLPSPVVSEKVMRLLNKAGIKGIQYLPIRFEHKDDASRVLSGYYVMNILNMLDDSVIDKEKSIMGAFSYFKYQLYEIKLEGCDIFRIKSDEAVYFVSEKFKNAIYDLVKNEIEFKEIRLS